MPKPTTRLIALLLAIIGASCGGGEEWPYASPAIDLPEGFVFQSSVDLRGRNAFPERDIDSRVGWELRRGGDISQVTLTRHGGSTSPEDVWGAVNKLEKDNQTWFFEGPDSRQIAGRPAWDWTAKVPSRQGGLWAVERSLVVSFPDSTWVLSFWGQHPEWHDEAKLDGVLASFRIPAPPRPLPKHPLIVALLLAAAAAVAWVKRPRPGPALPRPSREPVHTPNANPTMPTEPGRDPMVVQR